MIIKFGVAVVGARGTVGGLTFSANKGGPYAKLWSKGSNPRSTAQSDQRGILGQFASRWRDLAQVQRDDWNDYADDPAQEKFNSLSLSYFTSGFNWYVEINSNLAQAGEAARDDAPTLTRSAAPVIRGNSSLRTSGGPGVSRVEVTVGSPNPTFNHVLFTQVTFQGRTVWPSQRPFTIIAVPDGSLRIFPQVQLEATFGTIGIKQRAFYLLQIQDSHGQRSQDDTFRVDATAA